MLYIMRHGKTDWNVLHKLQGRTDIPLNEEGRNMARKAADIYKDIKLDDNKFEVLFCNVKSKLELLKKLSMLKKIDIRNIPDFEYYEINSMKIKFYDELNDSWCLDGEEMKHKSNTFKFNISKEINVLVPKVNIDKLFM